MGNALYRNGQIVTPGSEYQKWTGYPSSPVLTVDYPYQCIVKKVSDNITYLFVCPDNITYSPGPPLSTTYFSSILRAFRVYSYATGRWVYVDGKWVWESLPGEWVYETDSGAYGTVYADPPILEANTIVYEKDLLNPLTTVFFAKTTTVEQDGGSGSFTPVKVRRRSLKGKTVAGERRIRSLYKNKDALPTLTLFWSTTENPHGNWEYGRKPAKVGSFTLYNHLVHQSGMGWCWYTTNNYGDYSPLIWQNETAYTQYGCAPGKVSMHPGNLGEWSVVRWTAPASGRINAIGSFGAGDLANMTYSILHNNSISLFEASTTTRPFNLLVNVTQGDTLDFEIGGDFRYGNTPIDIDITMTTLRHRINLG